MTETEANNCRTGTTGCKICVGDNCNGKVDFQRCHRCDGVDCPQIQGATENLYTCNAYLDECGIQIGEFYVSFITKDRLLRLSNGWTDL